MNPVKRFLLILALTITWSLSFLFIKLALNDFSAVTTAFLRVFVASLIFLVALVVAKEKLPSDKTFWLHSCMMALFSSALPFFLFCYAETSIESALASILNGSTPMFTAMLAHFFLPGDRLSYQRSFGIFLSFFGVILLFYPHIARGMQGDFIGMSIALVGAFSYAVSHVYAKKYTTGKGRFVAPTAQMLLSSLFLLPPLLFASGIPQEFTMPTISGITGILGVTFFGTFAGLIIYYKLIDYSGPTDVSMVSCLFPVVGLFLGYFFLNESLTVAGLFSTSLILLGMLTVNEVIHWNFQKKPLPN